MKSIQVNDEIYDWRGKLELLLSPLYKITITEKTKIMEIVTDSSISGIVILGSVEVIVDAVIYTKSQGAFGNTTIFTGTNLVILGLSISELKNSIVQSDLNNKEKLQWKNEAQKMISKIKNRIECFDSPCFLDSDKCTDFDYIIFGRRNFFLIGSEEKYFLIHDNQIFVRKGDIKLIQINPADGITIAKRDKVINFGCASNTKLGLVIGELGVNLASSVLNQVLWV